MRHFVGYNADGKPVSLEYHAGGWPVDCDLNDLTCSNHNVKHLQETRSAARPDIVGYMLYDCPCPQGGKCPGCFNKYVVEHHVKNGAWVENTDIAILFDGTASTNNEIVTKTPGASVVMTVTGNVPDGSTITCIQDGPVDLAIVDTWELTFTGGATNAYTLKAPAQGTRGRVSVSGITVKPKRAYIRGFAIV